MKIFVINLEKDKERRISISQQLMALSLPYEIVTGIDGSLLTAQELSIHYDVRKARLRIARPLVPAEIGCALSHLEVYRRIINEGCKSALILEDDVILSEDLAPFLVESQISLNYHRPTVWLLSPATGHGKVTHFSDTDRELASYDYGDFTSSYVLTLQAAKSLLGELYPVGDVADCWSRMQRYRVVDIFVVTPALIEQHQEKFGSSTTDDVNRLFSSLKLQRVTYKVLRVRSILWDLLYTPYRRWLYPFIRHNYLIDKNKRRHNY